MLYRLSVRGADDGVVYGVKEFDAEDDEGAQAVAVSLVGEQPYWWDGQRLVVELEPVYRPPHERAKHEPVSPAGAGSVAAESQGVSFAGASS
jgi:hypothetical protein